MLDPAFVVPDNEYWFRSEVIMTDADGAMSERGLDLDNAFWRFSLAVYGAPGVAEECLALQRELDIDVNVLLFCAWFGAEHRVALTSRDLARLIGKVRGWHETVVRPLRTIRQEIKQRPEAAHQAVQELRKQVAAAELHAERIEQALLFRLMDAFEPCGEPAGLSELVEANIRTLLADHARARAGADIACPRLVAAAAAARRQVRSDIA